MSNIKISTNEQELTFVSSPLIASQGINEDYLEIDFDESWSGFGTVALFYVDGNEDEIYTTVVNNGPALVPHEVLGAEGKICFGLCGVKDDITQTSEILTYEIVKGIATAGSESEPPSPGIYEQMLSVVGAIQEAESDFETSINGQISTITESISDLENDLTALTGRVTTAEGNITALQQADQTLSSNISAIQTDLSEYMTRVDINCGARTCATNTGTVNFDIGISSYIPDGYRVFDVRCSTTQSYEFYCWYCDFVSGSDNQTVTVRIQKRSGTGGTIYPWICVTCVKEVTA